MKALMSILLFSIMLSPSVRRVEAYSVGVKVGQWAIYNTAGGNTVNESIIVKSVSSLNVTLSESDTYANGTKLNHNIDFNVRNCNSADYIRASNLAVNDTICDPTGAKIIQTGTRTFSGISRSVYIVIGGSCFGYDYQGEYTFAYDKLTGLLIEESPDLSCANSGDPFNLTSTDAFSSAVPTFTFQTLSFSALTALLALLALSVVIRPLFPIPYSKNQRRLLCPRT